MEYIPIGAICTVVGLLISYAVFSRGKTKDDKNDGEQSGIVLTTLGHIQSSIEAVNKKMDKQEDRHIELVERLSSVEASAKQAHKRLDRIEGREYAGHHEE